MTNLLGTAKELQQMIGEHPDFLALQQSYRDVMNDPKTKELFLNFRQLQMEMSQKMMQGQDITPEENMKSQQMVEALSKSEKITKLRETEQQMNQLITELNQVIMKPLEELYQL